VLTPPGSALVELVAVMDRLRRDCPWDARQTHQSLRPYLLEETYETLDALDRGAAERTDGTGFDIDDVAAGIAAKLKRRHPHVFGDVTVADADEVKRNWDAIKAAERAGSGSGARSALDGVPLAQPALALAAQLQRRAAAAGVPQWVAAAPAGSGASELGSELFALVTKAQAAGLDPELELRQAALAFGDRVRAFEANRQRDEGCGDDRQF